MLSRASPLVRRFTTASSAFTLPSLPYEYSALEPHISGQIMETHHQKHHQAYLTGFKAALEQLEAARHSGDVAKINALTQSLKFNGGGHFNHSIFWNNLAPVSEGGGEFPSSGPLYDQVKRDFGGVDELQKALTAASLGIQGSGWGWLGFNETQQRMEVVIRPNQDALTDLTPLLGLDVWEHAYYYKYGPARAEYLKNIWKVVNWRDVANRLTAVKK